MRARGRQRLPIVMAALAAVAPSPAIAQAPHAASSPSGDVVVTGTRARASDWREAETSHVVIQSDGPQDDLVRMARNVERLHYLLSVLMNRIDAPDQTVKLRVTMIGDVAEFAALDLRNIRWQQGPFNDLFTLARFYDPRSDGAVMATTRVDQQVTIEGTAATPDRILGALTGLTSATPGGGTGVDAGAAITDRAALASALIGDFATAGMRGPHDLTIGTGAPTMDVPAESLLYAGYAQHYLLTYFPAAYPRWYLDGFAQVFASMVVRHDGAIEFGRPPSNAAAVLREFGAFPLGDVLDDTYLSRAPGKTRWTPVHAWLLTHFLMFSDTRRPQLRRYLAMRAGGADAAAAAAVFGDPAQLARELRAYYNVRKPFLRITFPVDHGEEPLVRRLTEGEAAFVKGRLELGSRVTLPPPVPPDASPAVAKALTRQRADALAARDRWLERLHRDAARYPRDLNAQLLLAEAECRSDHPAPCLAAAQAAGALAPADVRPQTWQGLAMALAAIAGPAGEREAALTRARRLIIAANHRQTDAPGPLLAYHQTFVAAGQPLPVGAVDGMQQVMEEVPAAPGPRLALATALVDRGRADAARGVILPVAIGPYASPERPAAQALLARIGTPSPAGAGAPSRPADTAVGAPTGALPTP